MKSIKMPFQNKETILALGAESDGVFTIYKNGNIFISENFGDLLGENNFIKYKKTALEYLRKEKIKPGVILTDLHPLYKTTIFGEELAKKYKVSHIKVQHHIAHIFSAVGDRVILNTKYLIPNTFLGIAMDGTGYGLDGNIWGGEIFKITNDKLQMTNKIQNLKSKIKNQNLNSFNIERVGNLEEQIMIGGDLAAREPARMLIAILAKIPNPPEGVIPRPYGANKSQIPNKFQNPNPNFQKKLIYKFVKKYYNKNEFEALYSQMEQNFNCQKTTSTGRILDAASVLLGFAGNERKYKHEAAKLLEKNSTAPYFLEPKIISSVIASSPSADGERGNPVFPAVDTRLLRRSDDYIETPRNDKKWILQTTPLFEYLIKNIHKDKKRLAATAQLYIAKGFYEMIKQNHDSKFIIHDSCFAAGGLSNNKIISEYLEKKGVYLSKKIPRGDEGIAIGQVVHYLTNSRH